MMLRIFLGYDKKETVAFYVAAHSILRRASIPVTITPLNRDSMRSFYTRPRGEFDSTDFSNSRFLVPFLCGYQGFAVFMDSDVLCLGDVAEFGNYMTPMEHYRTSVRVVKHEYEVKDDTKFLGQKQTKYSMKNWSSVMLFNNALCEKLTLDYCINAPGLDLHQFAWTDPERVMDLPKGWNFLCGEDNQANAADVKLVHFTKGTPCFVGYEDQPYAEQWFSEWRDMNSCAGGMARRML